MDNNLALVGFYYFKSGQELILAIEKQLAKEVKIKGEYFLADAINIMLESGEVKMRTEKVSVWLDAGTLKAILSTNRYLLDHGHGNSQKASQRLGVCINPPVYIHPEAVVKSSVIGPYTTVGAGCKISGSSIQNTIIEEGSRVEGTSLDNSFIGQNATIKGRANSINIGDNTEIEI
jgi:glucose-1-phosphate thymidylyltransferase